MNSAIADAKVTISDGHTEVETTVGDLERLASPLGITTQMSSKEDFLTAIRNASREIAIRKQEWKTAKEMQAEEIEQLDEWLEAESANDTFKAAKEKLKTAKLSSEAVQDATETVTDKKDALDLQRQIRSDLLVLYAAKFNRRTAESIEPGENRRIVLSAKVGKIEPEQLGLF